MLYVQSFWSKPMFENDLKLEKNSWYSKRTFYYGTALSALLLDKHNPKNTVLITDQMGKRLLLDILNLPYEKVLVELDYLNKYDSGLWALGKIYSYSLMKEPFVHFDFDFFLSSRLPERIENAELCAWVPELGKNYQNTVYRPAMELLLKSYNTFHSKFQYFLDHGFWYAYNAGIIGGSCLSIFKELKEMAFFMVDNNSSSSELNDRFNIILEQYIYAGLAKLYKKEIICLEDDFHFAKFSVNQSLHLLGPGKKVPLSCKEVEEILINEFPEYYNKINCLIQNNEI